jgi:DNA polymerase-3 subunit alpha
VNERDLFLKLCIKGMEDRKLLEPQHKERLKLELKEIDDQADHEYFIDLVRKGWTFPENDNNLFCAYVLGLCREPNLDAPPEFAQGEFPDIDTDYLPKIQEYLRHVWAPATFGRDNTCDIGTTNTMGLKSVMQAMAKVHGLPREDILVVTKKFEDKDDEGKPLDWDKAIALYPEFAEYCERHPEVAEAGKMLLHRRKSGGVHPGGLIISSIPLMDLVPLEVRSVDKQNKYGVICSAWSEGQAVQDLQPVGLVKFDILAVIELEQIGLATHLIRMRHGINRICAKPGGRNWSDTSYLNDPKAIAMANAGDLKCIFQSSSEGMRKLIKTGGVTSFDDIPAYSSLYRPGPMGMKMHEAYCRRKQGLEEYTLHPLMEPILGKTYGVMAYQEQVMKILNVVGNIPLIHCEKVRKAISKKKLELFGKYKEMFFRNGVKNLNCSLEYIQNLWDQVESFADYGFNKSHAYAYAYITARQLYLKAHYPLEFYTATLICAKDSTAVKDAKLDAHQHGVEVAPVHINKSADTFQIVDDKIYFGFSNLKKVGEKIAERIVENQPYKSFEDFLERFGTEIECRQAFVFARCLRRSVRASYLVEVLQLLQGLGQQT